jgi:hypothetical protein
VPATLGGTALTLWAMYALSELTALASRALRRYLETGELFLLFPLVGALIDARRPRNPVGWTLPADGVLWMLSDVIDYYVIYGVARPGSVPFPLGIVGMNDRLWGPSVGLLGTYVFLLSPTGGLRPRGGAPGLASRGCNRAG